MYYERKFTEAMLLITGLLACLVITVYLTSPAKADIQLLDCWQSGHIS